MKELCSAIDLDSAEALWNRSSSYTRVGITFNRNDELYRVRMHLHPVMVSMEVLKNSTWTKLVVLRVEHIPECLLSPGVFHEPSFNQKLFLRAAFLHEHKQESWRPPTYWCRSNCKAYEEFLDQLLEQEIGGLLLSVIGPRRIADRDAFVFKNLAMLLQENEHNNFSLDIGIDKIERAIASNLPECLLLLLHHLADYNAKRNPKNSRVSTPYITGACLRRLRSFAQTQSVTCGGCLHILDGIMTNTNRVQHEGLYYYFIPDHLSERLSALMRTHAT